MRRLLPLALLAAVAVGCGSGDASDPGMGPAGPTVGKSADTAPSQVPSPQDQAANQGTVKGYRDK